jgi:hypothetical protein
LAEQGNQTDWKPNSESGDNGVTPEATRTEALLRRGSQEAGNRREVREKPEKLSPLFAHADRGVRKIRRVAVLLTAKGPTDLLPQTFHDHIGSAAMAGFM